jgi:hypothetical protein
MNFSGNSITRHRKREYATVIKKFGPKADLGPELVDECVVLEADPSI